MGVWTINHLASTHARCSCATRTSARCEGTEPSRMDCAPGPAASVSVCAQMNPCFALGEYQSYPVFCLTRCFCCFVWVTVEELDNAAVEKCDQECENAKNEDRKNENTFVTLPSLVLNPSWHIRQNECAHAPVESWSVWLSLAWCGPHVHAPCLTRMPCGCQVCILHGFHRMQNRLPLFCSRPTIDVYRFVMVILRINKYPHIHTMVPKLKNHFANSQTPICV